MRDRRSFRHLFAAVDGPRFRMLLAAAVTRGAGFIISFLIARTSGAQALGEYAALANTASSAIQPFVHVINNNATLLAVDAHRRDVTSVRLMALANLLLALALSGAAYPLFLLLRHLAPSGTSNPEYVLLLGFIAAGSTIVGQLSGAVLLGTYHGTGRFVESARVSVAVSIMVIVLAIPAIFAWGLAGAYMTLTFASIAPPLVFAHGVFQGGRHAAPIALVHMEAMSKAGKQLLESLPSILTTAVGAAAYWLCTIYFVQRPFGVEGIGLIAVAMQWLTIMLLAEATWGSVSLKILAEAVGSGSASAVRKAMRGLLKKNLAVTLAGSLVVTIGAGWIADFYGLGNTGLDVLIRLNAACAIIFACINILQRLLLCLKRQGVWFSFSVVRFAAQVSITGAFIEAGLFVVMVAILAGSILQMVLAGLSVNKLLIEALPVRE